MMAVPLLLHPVDHAEQPLDLAIFQRRGRLVENEDAAFQPQRLGDGDKLALGEAQRLHRAVEIGAEN